MPTTRSLARTTGLLYLALAVFGGWAHLVARSSVYVPGDAAATTAAISENATVFRLAFLADLTQATLFVFVALGLYRLLHHVSESLARTMVVLVAIAAGMICLNMVHHMGALLVATEPAYAALGPATQEGLTLLLMDLHHWGYLCAQMFFGLWLVPLGMLVLREGTYPRPLGWFLVAGGIGYVAALAVEALAPGTGDGALLALTAPSVVGEFWMIGYLLVRAGRR